MGVVVNFKDQSLDQLLNEYHRQFGIALDHDTKGQNARLKAAAILKDMQERVEAGEAGEGVKWWDWYREHSVRSRRDAERLLKIAKSENPKEALEQEREDARESMAKTRSQQKDTTNVCRNFNDSDDNSTTANSWGDDYQRKLYRDALFLIDQMDAGTIAELISELKQRRLL